jgi:hypothetical protein
VRIKIRPKLVERNLLKSLVGEQNKHVVKH